MATASADTLVTMQKGRLAVQNLACVPQAQRRYIQIGWMPDAIANLDNAVANLDQITEEGAITPDQADQMREVHRLLHHGLDTHDNFLEFDSEKDDEREFILSDALQNDDWEAIRQAARKLFGDIAGEGSVFIAINAK
jgi:hypothetical protein